MENLMRLSMVAAAALVAGPTVACTVTASTIGFGVYRSATDSTSTGSITVECALNTTYEVQLLAGNGTYSSRRLQGDSGGELLYNLYTAPDYIQVWGDGIESGTVKVISTGTGQPEALTVYGLVPSGQKPAVGTYSDSVVVTVNF